MAYVYQHIRMDTNEVYYVGIGKNENTYKRANSKLNRNIWWKRINDKVETKIEILKSGISWEEAIVFEKYYINLYGRKDLGQGNLVNLTDGGEGTINVIRSEEQINRLKKYNTSRIFTEETRKKISEAAIGRPGYGKKALLQFDKQGNLIKEFESVFSTRLDGYNFKKVQNCLRREKNSHQGFRWCLKEVWENYTQEEKEKVIYEFANYKKKYNKPYKEKVKRVYKRVENPKDCRKKIEQFDLNENFIQEYESITSTKEKGFNPKKISECLGGRAKTHKGFIWKYKHHTGVI